MTIDEWRRAVEKRLGWKEGESTSSSPQMVREMVRVTHPDLYARFDTLGTESQPIWLSKPLTLQEIAYPDPKTRRRW